ncbi:beta-lactamase family protein [Actinoplanes sp. TRM 88003]|uniref:Beta-lactamase family protein n=1 Tax=Paractinoplanes aksuensis TaxID=2939490 RepID=A0ABT1E485_9ACTN|nr:serine hydrolase domain-containing protein [Actinoplanes aksuensis]MCO8277937.1 beta-lactamase family protein [Actinoplanes aksuensis]
MRKILPAVLVLSLTLAVPAPARAAEPGFEGYLREAFASTGLPGMSAVVTRGDRVVYSGGFGPGVTADTPMRVASVSKSFTAAAVLTLVDEGRVELDQPVVTYLPEFSLADPRSQRITVRQLLNQTSGLSDRTVDIRATQRAADLTGYVAALRDGKPAGEPGARYEYCNVNFDVAARLVEAVDGRPFDVALRERVFGPLGMRASTVGDDVPRGHISLYGAWVRRAELPGFRGGAGGVVTTASDMGRWLISRNRATPDSLPAGSDYAMGWGVESVEGRRLLVHSGNLFTYTAVQALDPATGYGYAVMTNSAALYDDMYDVMLGLVALANGSTPEAPGGQRQRLELGLGLTALVAAGLGVCGVLRSGRWATRRAGRAGWWTGLRLGAGLLPAVLLATYPQWVSFLSNGRTVTWAQLTYFAAPLTITLSVAAVAGLATVVARVRSWRAVTK